MRAWSSGWSLLGIFLLHFQPLKALDTQLKSTQESLSFITHLPSPISIFKLESFIDYLSLGKFYRLPQDE